MGAVKWTDAEEIGWRLYEADPDQDPLTVRFSDLRERVLSLEEFDDDPAAGSEGSLEAIQMAWLDCFQQQ